MQINPLWVQVSRTEERTDRHMTKVTSRLPKKRAISLVNYEV